MKIIWSRGMATRAVQQALRQVVIVSVQWTLLTLNYTRKEEAKWGKGKCVTYIRCKW